MLLDVAVAAETATEVVVDALVDVLVGAVVLAILLELTLDEEQSAGALLVFFGEEGKGEFGGRMIFFDRYPGYQS